MCRRSFRNVGVRASAAEGREGEKERRGERRTQAGFAHRRTRCHYHSPKHPDMPFALTRLLAIALALWSLPCPAADWKAGAARVKITPERPMWMSGYASRTGPAEGTL